MLLRVVNPRCDKCGQSNENIAQFADTFRQYEIKHGRRHPGNLCGKCAGDLTSARLYQEAKDKLRPVNADAAKEYDELLRQNENSRHIRVR